MMIILNRLGDMITGSLNGESFSVSFDEKKYELMQNLRDKSEEIGTMQEMHAVIEEFKPLITESFKELIETASPYVMVNKHTNKFYLKYGGKVSRHPFPQALATRILKSIEKGIDVAPLVKCWARFIREVPGRPPFSEKRANLFAEYINATYTDDVKVAKLMASEGFAKQVAIDAATTTQVAITQEGLLVCYKVSREITKKFVKNPEQDGGVKEVDRYDYDVNEFSGIKTYKEPEHVEARVFEPPVMGQGGDAFYCGEDLGHVIRVGRVHKLPDWSFVDGDDNRTGSRGLHVGGLRYIAGYQNDGSVTHNIFVDPMDIGAIVGVGYGNDGAMRVYRYFVHSSFAGPNKSIYHSSKYAALTDAEYGEMIKLIVEQTAMKERELKSILTENEALAIISKKNPDGVAGVNLGAVLEIEK